MKRFILTVLCVSVFFIGIGSIIEKTNAKFMSDAKALEIINNARIAIGGDANLSQVRSMTIKASTTHFYEKEGIQNTKQGAVEINMQMPNQFSKMVKIGDSNAVGNTEIHKEIRVIATDNEGGEMEFKNEDGTKKKDVFIFRKGEGGNLDWKSDSKGKVKIDGDKIIIKNDDGTTEEIKIDGKKKIRIKKDANGNIISEDVNEIDSKDIVVMETGEGNTFTEDIENIDGSKVIIMKGADGKVVSENIVGPHKMKFRKHGGMRGNEMLRTTIALLLTPPAGMDVSYKFAGMGDVDGNPSNIIDVSANHSTFKLYIDASTHLPQMISYQGHRNVFFMKKEGMKEMSKEEIIAMKEKMRNKKRVETQLKFSDFRSVGNLLLPHRWTESAGGKQIHNLDITAYEINPENIADKFGKQRVFIKKTK